MQESFKVETYPVSSDTYALRTFAPLPGLGLLAVNAFLIQAAQPVLVDTGMIGDRDDFMVALRSIIDLEDLRWLWLSHTHPDHIGSIVQVLKEAPNARLVTTYVGMGFLGLMQLPLDRAYLLNPGQALDVGDRQLVAVKPPTYDAPESTGFMDEKTGTLFSVDCFGALLNEPAETAADIPPTDLRNGLVTWSTVDAPWLAIVKEQAFARSLDAVRELEPNTILSSHLPPAIGMTGDLLNYLAAARLAPPFVGPDQAALEQMMAGTAPG
jgi:glyoxylase-like metal-dependent hydrolase (beta-lactamase superfamily II)